jgi:hypothetical protein
VPEIPILDLSALEKSQVEESKPIRLVLTATSRGNTIEGLVYVPPGELRFRDDAPDCKIAVLKWRIGAGDSATVHYHATDLRVCGKTATEILHSGLVYAFERRLAQPGTYDLRVELEETTAGSEHFGAAARSISVPDSGITLQLEGAVPPAAITATSEGNVLTASYRVPTNTDPAIRRFRPGDAIVYDVLSPAPQSGLTLRVEHNGATIYTGTAEAHGVYRLEPHAEPGDYALVVAAGERKQSIGFEVAAAAFQPPAAPPPQPETSALPSTLEPPASSLDAKTRMALLVRVRDRMREGVQGIPNFTCTEEIVRTRNATSPPRRLHVDRARLEVAVVGGKELFAWPGEDHFEKDDPSKIVTGGMTSSGDYATLTALVFGLDDVLYSRGLDQDLQGRPAIRYDYRIPGMPYEVRTGQLHASVGLQGSFWVDRETENVLALAVMARNIPPTVPVTALTIVIAFRPVVLDGHSYLLPDNAQITAKLHPSGERIENTVHFRNCRHYSGESRLILGDAVTDSAAESEQVAVGARALARGASLELTLDQPIDTALAAAGDRVTATTTAPVKAGNVTIPAGARAVGRILNLEFDLERSTIRAVVEFDHIEHGGANYDFHARLRSRVRAGATHCEPGQAPETAAITLGNGQTRVPAGLKMKWETL